MFNRIFQGLDDSKMWAVKFRGALGKNVLFQFFRHSNWSFAFCKEPLFLHIMFENAVEAMSCKICEKRNFSSSKIISGNSR